HGLVLHYDLLRSVVANYPSIAHDEALELLDCAGATVVYTLVCPLPVLRERVRERLRVERGPGSIRNLEVALRLYEDPARVRRVYEAWGDYLAARGLALELVDTSTDAYELRDRGILGE